MNGKKDTALGGQDFRTVSELANLKVTAAGGRKNCMVGFSTVHAFGENNTVGAANTLAAEVPAGTERVEITPAAMSSNASVTVDGMALTGGKASVTLNNGAKTVKIAVTAPDGKSTRTYSLTIRTAAAPGNP